MSNPKIERFDATDGPVDTPSDLVLPPTVDDLPAAGGDDTQPSTADPAAVLQAEVTARLEAVSRMQDELVGLTGRASTLDGHVTVTVTPSGSPTALHIGDQVMHLPGDDLARHILEAVAAATAEVGERLRAIVGSVVPAEDLEAMMRGDVTEADRTAVRDELATRQGGSR